MLAPEAGAEATLGLALAAVGEVDLLAGMPRRAMAASAVSFLGAVVTGAGVVVLLAATGGKLPVLASAEEGEGKEFPLRGEGTAPAAVGVVAPPEATDDGEGRSGMDVLLGALNQAFKFFASKITRRNIECGFFG